MKNIAKYIKIASLAILATVASCSKILEEQPRSIYEPGFFETERGIMGGLTSMYAHLRWIYGQAYWYNSVLTGTDEVTYAQQADQNFLVMDLSGRAVMNAENSRADAIWGVCFSNINTANGIVEFAENVDGITEAHIAEAKFFRAFDYFLLVQTFGGVPLDLGAGELVFNTSTTRTSVRNTVPEVYTKAVFPDLLHAVENLPESGRVIGGVTKTLARLYLAKAYLTYGWWLQNPENIPTYPAADRVDPDGHDAQWYFQQAYDMAVQGIENPGPFALQPTFYGVHVATNDRNNELLLFADHTESSEFYNGGSLSYGSGGAPDNFASWMLTWNYTEIRSSSSSSAWTPVASVQREAAQALGRPWVRMAPTIGAITNTFADKTNDSRYDGTFTSVYRGNWNKAGIQGTFYNANFLPVNPGDAILTFLNEEPSEAINYSTPTSSNVGAGVLPGRADFVVSPTGISRRIYPGIWKIGPYRTDSGSGLGEPNAGSTRPFAAAKFSELYLVAAEAAVKGAVAKAGFSSRELVNVIRARAGVWRWDNNGNTERVEDNSAAMIAATPADITIEYILAERSREYFGEGYRWHDLVRTQKWRDIASTYVICGPNLGDRTPITFQRNIQNFHYLRPIPLGQLDAMEGDRSIYQNPGYD